MENNLKYQIKHINGTPHYAIVLGFVDKSIATNTLEIPAKINNAPVSSIRDKAFENTAITCLRIPSSLKYIGKCAFRNCAELKKVTALMPISTTIDALFIDKSAFENCKNIISFNLTQDIFQIGADCFRNCEGLQQLDVPILNVCQSAFYGCKQLKTIMLLHGGSLRNSCLDESAIKQIKCLDSGIHIAEQTQNYIKNHDVTLFCYDYSSIKEFAYAGLPVVVVVST